MRRLGVTATDWVHEQIKNGILVGEYRSGSFIREGVIASQLAVSRTPIREAIRRLVSEGWLESIPNCGARVVEWTATDVDEVFELRALLEPRVATRAVERIRDAQVEELERLAETMELLAAQGSAEARDQITRLNQRFHGIVTEAAASPRIQRVLQSIVLVPVVRRSFHGFTVEELQRSMGHHRELIQALKARDGQWAAAVMRAHVLAARAVLMRGAAALEQPGDSAEAP